MSDGDEDENEDEGGPAAEVVGIYRRHVAAFDQERSRALFEKGWLDRFLALLPRGGAVLDLGCGMGEPIARYLIENGCRVTGLDSSEGMLALCRARFPGQEWVPGDMRALDLGQRFDGVIGWGSFFFLTPDQQRAMFPRFAAHAAAGCALMLTTGPRAGSVVGSYCGEPLYHASLAPEEYRALLRASGFEVVDCRLEDPDCAGYSVWLARMAGVGA